MIFVVITFPRRTDRNKINKNGKQPHVSTILRGTGKNCGISIVLCKSGGCCNIICGRAHCLQEAIVLFSIVNNERNVFF